MPDHSPLPWIAETLKVIASVDPEDGREQTMIVDADSMAVCQRIKPADAAFIVRAVNSHAELVAVVEHIATQRTVSLTLMRAILAKAKGEQ